MSEEEESLFSLNADLIRAAVISAGCRKVKKRRTSKVRLTGDEAEDVPESELEKLTPEERKRFDFFRASCRLPSRKNGRLFCDFNERVRG
jgi:hypothetical protein